MAGYGGGPAGVAGPLRTNVRGRPTVRYSRPWGSAGSAVGQLLPFHLVEPAPDAVRLVDTDGVIEAFDAHRARPADRLGPLLALELLVLALGMGRREEHLGVWPAAGGLQLP